MDNFADLKIIFTIQHIIEECTKALKDFENIPELLNILDKESTLAKLKAIESDIKNILKLNI